MSVYDVVVIGSGPAGVAAAVNAASEGLSTVVLAGDRGGQASGSSRIENYLGFPQGISGHELMDAACAQADRFGVLMVDTTAVGLVQDASKTRWYVEDAESYVYAARSVVLAMGVDYRQLGVYGEELPEVTYGLDPKLEHDPREHVLIVGGANSAGQAALNAAKTAGHVTILARSKLSKGMSAYLEERIAADPKISVLNGTATTIMRGADSTDADRRYHLSVELNARAYSGPEPNGRRVRRVRVSRMAIFIGATPRTAWLPLDVLRDERGFILTDYDVQPRMRVPANERRSRYPFETSCMGVFAAGDVRYASVKRVAAAAGEGAQAVSSVHRYLAD